MEKAKTLIGFLLIATVAIGAVYLIRKKDKNDAISR